LLALARKKSGQAPVEGRPADLLAPRLSAIKEELVKKSIEPSDDNAVLYAMFPRETDALYNKKPAVPAPQPIGIASPAAAAASQQAVVAATIHTIRKFYITINNRRSEVLVEELN
jgi:pyruvate/oxaloacetate carboxyltransferase